MDKATYLRFVIEIMRRDGQKGFEVLPRRWVVERTFANSGAFSSVSENLI
jgi:transposase